MKQRGGVIAAVLGNAKNRGNFSNKAWWDEQTGLQTYFKAITGQISRNPDDYKDKVVPPVIEECDAPADPNEAMERWIAVRGKFRRALAKAQEVNALAQQAYESQKLIRGYEKKAIAVESKIREQTSPTTQHRQNLEQAKERRIRTESALNHARQNLEASNNSRPGLISRLFLRTKWHLWCQQHKKFHKAISVKSQAFDNASGQYHQAYDAHKVAVSGLDTLKREKKLLETSYQQATRNIQAAAYACEGALVTLIFGVPPTKSNNYSPPIIYL